MKVNAIDRQARSINCAVIRCCLGTERRRDIIKAPEYAAKQRCSAGTGARQKSPGAPRHAGFLAYMHDASLELGPRPALRAGNRARRPNLPAGLQAHVTEATLRVLPPRPPRQHLTETPKRTAVHGTPQQTSSLTRLFRTARKQKRCSCRLVVESRTHVHTHRPPVESKGRPHCRRLILGHPSI